MAAPSDSPQDPETGRVVDPAELSARRARRAEQDEDDPVERAQRAERLVVALEHRLGEVEAHLATAQRERGALAADLVRAEQELTAAQQREHAEQRRRVELEGETAERVRVLEGQRTRLEAELDTATDRADELGEALAAARSALDVAREEQRTARVRADGEREHAAAELTHLRGALQRRAAIQDAVIAQIAELRDALETLRARASLEDEALAVARDAALADRDRLQAALTGAEAEALADRAAMTAARDDAAALREQLALREAELGDERAAVGAAQAEAEALCGRLAAQEAELEKLHSAQAGQAERDAAVEALVAQLVAAVEELRTEFTAELATLEAAYAAHQVDVAEVAALEQRVEELRAELETGAERLRVEVAAEQDARAAAEAAAHQSAGRLAAAEAAARESAERLEAAARESAERLEVAEAAARESAERLEAAETAAGEMAERLVAAEAAARASGERVATAEAELARSVADRDALTLELAGVAERTEPAPPVAAVPEPAAADADEDDPIAPDAPAVRRPGPPPASAADYPDLLAGRPAVAVEPPAVVADLTLALERLRSLEPPRAPSPPRRDSAPTPPDVPAPPTRDVPAPPTRDVAAPPAGRPTPPADLADLPKPPSLRPASADAPPAVADAPPPTLAAPAAEPLPVEVAPPAAVEEPLAVGVAPPAAAEEPLAVEVAPPAVVDEPPAVEAGPPTAAEPPEPEPPAPEPWRPPAPVPAAASWLADALLTLAGVDEATAERVLLAALPIQGLRASKRTSYVVELPASGAHTVTVVPREGVTVQDGAALGGGGDFRLAGTVAALAPLVAGAATRRLAGVATTGRRRRARRLLRGLRAPVGLGELDAAGARLRPGDVLVLLCASVPRGAVAGHDFGVAYVADEPGGRRSRTLVRAEPDGSLTAIPEAPEVFAADATVTVPPGALLRVLGGGLEPEVEGDAAAVDALQRWLRAVQGAPPRPGY